MSAEGGSETLPLAFALMAPHHLCHFYSAGLCGHRLIPCDSPWWNSRDGAGSQTLWLGPPHRPWLVSRDVPLNRLLRPLCLSSSCTRGSDGISTSIWNSFLATSASFPRTVNLLAIGGSNFSIQWKTPGVCLPDRALDLGAVVQRGARLLQMKIHGLHMLE